MKRVVIFVICLPIHASHVARSSDEKRLFVQKRLDMMQQQLITKRTQISAVKQGSREAQTLLQEILQLKESIPLTQQSLNALKGKLT